ncbi:sensor histidine kinase [Microbacterium ulmi]|uniref:Oxygen sensor histidine kinase NreB n=1 Tax=Microbacterium ulmi TaxID=179095 RepID=A0A7Y2M299_9MICO|nr:GAF domain-containing sensor histidine kinase [Microbacterium ulmi]NII69697.1 signal transduction histidine kinase [Microbacterium ulmi]NNH05002.1 GAF domain-containing sensor histidine kinase [Microbacterium ulmi]
MTTSALPGDASGLRLRGGARSGSAVRPVIAWGLVGLSSTCWVVVVVAAFSADLWHFLPWMVMYAVTVAVAIVVLVRRPQHPLVPWLALATLVTVFEVAIWGLREALAASAPDATVALWNLAQECLYLIPAIAVARVLGLFADGVVQRPYEQVVLRLTWLALLVPIVLIASSPTVVLPFYVSDESIPNPFANPLVAIDPRIGGVAQEVTGPAVVIVGAVLLALRYRRADARARRPMRWLLVPVALMPIPLVSQAVLTGAADVFVSLAWGAVVIGFAVAIGLGMLQPAGLNADRVVRGTVLYGLLWTVIAVVFVIVASTVGTAAGALLPVGWAVAVAMVAAVAFQPVRARLERLADRWVFGARTDPAQLVVGLGESLAGTYDLDALLPRMRATLEDGMGLRWARVRLLRSDGGTGAADGEPPAALVVPIEVDGERVGMIECGQKTSGHLSGADVAIIETFARQAGMAVRNVRLKQELTDQAALLRTSRARLARAQEQERRRIERNIHDGVQQDLTALIGLVGQARQEYGRSGDAVGEDLERAQEGLRRVLADLRDFAQGIHPSVLSDHGLLAAVEALAGRHPVAVEVRADPVLRGIRLSDEVEGAAYFTLAEALANTLKHGSAHRIEIELHLEGRALEVCARDDGVGFDVERATGSGLANLRERVAALGGRLEVVSRPGGGTTVTAEFPIAAERSPQ